MAAAGETDRRAVVPASHWKSHWTSPAQGPSKDKRRRKEGKNWDTNWICLRGELDTGKTGKYAEMMLCEM